MATLAGIASGVGIAVGVLRGLDIIKRWFLPDKTQEEILRCCNQLSNEIHQVGDEIKDLEHLIKWEITQLQYGDAVTRIELGLEYCLEFGKGSGKDEKLRYQERLKEACANQTLTLALNALLDGMAGKGLFRKSILDEFYNETKGDRPKISALANRLEQLVCGGMIALATYETVMRGEEGAKEITKKYVRKFKEAFDKVQSVIGGCEKNFQGNMISDLNAFLDTVRSNEDLVAEISDFMSNKYDWLENFCLVYNDLHGFDQHCIGGYYAHSFHRNEKCGVVFYRTKGEKPRFSGKYNEAYKIVDDACKTSDGGLVLYGNAQEGHKIIVANIKASGIGWSGCAVITRSPDLQIRNTFSTKTVTVIGKSTTAVLLLQ